MKVIDLIIKLQQLPANMEVMIDITREDTTGGFRFVGIEFADLVGFATGGEAIVISHQNLEQEDEF